MDEKKNEPYTVRALGILTACCCGSLFAVCWMAAHAFGNIVLKPTEVAFFFLLGLGVAGGILAGVLEELGRVVLQGLLFFFTWTVPLLAIWAIWNGPWKEPGEGILGGLILGVIALLVSGLSWGIRSQLRRAYLAKTEGESTDI